MKKFGGYILLFLIIANLFAPISLQKNSSQLINKVFAEELPKVAEQCNNEKEICVSLVGTKMGSGATSANNTKSYIEFGLSIWQKNNLVGFRSTVLTIKDDKNNIVAHLNTGLGSTAEITKEGIQPTTKTTTVTYKGNDEWLVSDLRYILNNLSASSLYTIEISVAKISDSLDSAKFLELQNTDDSFKKFPFDFSKYPSAKGFTSGKTSFTTPAPGTLGVSASGAAISATGTVDSVMPACAIAPQWAGGGEGTIMGCVAQLLYYVLFVPSSFLFALGGKFFDFAFHYSIQDSSYRTGFVVEGWKIVRDLCNIFFIFLLLSAAIKMILNIGHGQKSTIIKVIVIGLLINFSLFTTQIVIDSSNILARLFYNADAIKIVVTGNKDTTNGLTSVASGVYGNGELPLSAAIVDKVDPQAIIINAKNINVRTQSSSVLSNPNAQDLNTGSQGIGVGTFILIVFITTIINLLGFFVFISVALVFVGRVVGLWFSMIFVPLAFFSYAAPNLPEGLKRFGWSSWWSELIGTAFVAPVFMFMLYLILLFLSKGFVGLFDADVEGPEFILQTVIPFIVIMIMLWQAKSVAGDMSKGVASSVTSGLKVAGGAALMLGGAGVGYAGRNVIGKTIAKASSGTTATQKYETAKAALTTAGGRDPSLYNALSKKEKILGNIGSKMQLGKVFGKTQVTAAVDERGRRIANTASVGGVQGGIGGAINKSQKKVGGINHAIHDYAETAKEAHIDPKRKFSELSEIEKSNMKKSFYALNKSKFESKIKNGLVDGTESEADYKTRERNVQTAAWAAAGYTPTTEDKNKLETKLSNDYKTVILEPALKDKLSHDFTHTMEGASEKISFKDRITSDAPSGTYNPLNLSKLESIKNDAFATKLIFGITNAVALGMRTGMKNVPGVNMGTGSRTFKDDMKNVFSEAIKGVNFKLESPGGGGGHGGGHDDHGHGGGHDDHGGGHH